jgi:hypothetical protein
MVRGLIWDDLEHSFLGPLSLPSSLYVKQDIYGIFLVAINCEHKQKQSLMQNPKIKEQPTLANLFI